jgi:ATP/maltotriose-dependent transcriptional regulator MalT/DNA-binding SARP family transcriptional activator
MTRRPALAKISRPRLHQPVPRERLFALLDQRRAAPLLWLAGPPGSGKTTLAATFVASRGLPAVWYQVDAGDADPAAFFFYLAQALPRQRAAPPLPQLLAEHRRDVKGFARRFFRQFFARLPEDGLLVLDNFQEAADSTLATIVRAACAEIPPHANVLAISRSEPPPAFAEMQGRDALALIDWDALRLTVEETRAMSAARGVQEDWVVRALHQQADGWAAGVTLMLERFRRAGGGGGMLSGDTRESVFHYFAALIFDQVPEASRQTLLALAFLPRATPSLAVALSGNPDAGKLLESLHRRHLFTDRRDGREPVYQFHALFQAFLQAKAAESSSPEMLQARLRETGLALAERAEGEAAFDLLLRSQAWDDAAAVAVADAPELLATGRWQTLAQRIDALPAVQREREPWLDYWRARAQALTDPSQAVAAFERAHARFTGNGDRAGAVMSLAGLLHASSVDYADYRTSDRWLDTMAEQMRAPDLALSPEQELAAASALLWAAFFTRPWHPCIVPALDRVEALLGRVQNAAVVLEAATCALAVSYQSHEIGRCDRLAARVWSLANQPNVSPVLAAWGLYHLGHQRFTRADYEGSIACFETLWSIAQANALDKVLTAALMHRFMIDFRLGDPAQAETSMRRIEALPPPAHAQSRALLTCYRARLAQVRGEPQRAADLAEHAQADICRTGSGFQEAIYGLINGEILLGAGRAAEARPLLERSRRLIERSAALSTLYPSLLLVEAWLAQVEGREQDCLHALREGLQRSQTDHGWCQMRYVDTAGAHMFRLALARGVEADTAKRLIRLFRLKARLGDGEQWPWPLRLRTLGRFEALVDDRVLEFGRKTPKKALSLLKVLIALGPREVPEPQVLDALWPDEEGDAAHKSLSITLLRLRRLLGDNDLVRQRGGRLSLDAQRCWVDAWAFECDLAGPPSARLAGSDATLAMARTVALYGGGFLPDDAEQSWTLPARERLRSKYIQALGALCATLEQDGRYDEAIDWYLKGLDADAIVEPFYQGLMRCYEKLDRRPEAVAAYRRLSQTLSVTLGLRPSAGTERLYQALRAQ